MNQKFILAHETARKGAARAVLAAPDGYYVEIKPPTRSLDQNARLWASLSDLATQTDWHGIRLVSDEWKDLLSAGLVKSKVVPNMEGTGFVILGQRTSKMSKKQFSDLLELIYAFGNERCVRWSEPGLYRPEK
jgi:glycyl-tRNA synthetase alpha subunit